MIIHTGIIRRVDDLGRIVIPKDIRRQMGISEGDPLEISVGDGNKIIFTKYISELNVFGHLDQAIAALEERRDITSDIDEANQCKKIIDTLKKIEKENKNLRLSSD